MIGEFGGDGRRDVIGLTIGGDEPSGDLVSKIDGVGGGEVGIIEPIVIVPGEVGLVNV